MPWTIGRWLQERNREGGELLNGEIGKARKGMGACGKEGEEGAKKSGLPYQGGGEVFCYFVFVSILAGERAPKRQVSYESTFHFSFFHWWAGKCKRRPNSPPKQNERPSMVYFWKKSYLPLQAEFMFPP